MMESTLRLYDLLEKKLGKEEAREFAKVLEEVIRDYTKEESKRIEEGHKIQTKEELFKTVATKEDIKSSEKVLQAEIKRVEDTLRAEIRRVEAEIRRLEAYMKIMVVLLLIAIALYSPIFAQLVGRFLKP